MTRLAFCLVALLAFAGPLDAQTHEVVRGRRVGPAPTISVRNQAGSVRIVAWPYDSVMVRGTFPDAAEILFFGGDDAMKVGVWDWVQGGEAEPAHFEVFVPFQSSLAVKTVGATVTAVGVSGWFGSVNGHIRVTGEAARVEVETVGGDVEIDVDADWIRARTGSGTLSVRGTVADLGASSVSGRLFAATRGTRRGNFQSVSGDIYFSGMLPAGGLFEFDNHSGTVELSLPPMTNGTLDLATVDGIIDNGLTDDRAAFSRESGHELVVTAAESGARVTVRTFRGAILLRRR